MTHIERMVYWFRMHQGKATLGEILRSGEPWSYEFRARMTDAKKRGVAFFSCQQDHKQPSMNLYRLIEKSGQMELI